MKILLFACSIIVQCSTKTNNRGDSVVAPVVSPVSSWCPNGQVWSRTRETCLTVFLTDYYYDDYYDDLELALHTAEPSTTNNPPIVEDVGGTWGQWSPYSDCQGVGQIGKKTRMRKCSDNLGNGCGWTQQNEDKPCLL